MSIFEGIQFFLANTLQAEERIVLRELLEERGARSVTLPQATHIVTSNLEFEGNGSASVNAIAVSKEWVEKCIIHDRLLSTEGYSADRNKLFSGVVACGAELSDSDVEVLSAGITALGGSWRSGLTKEVTHLFATAPGSEKYNIALYYARDTRVKIVHPLWFDDSIRLGFRALTNAYEYPEPPILEAGDDGASTAAMALSDSRKDIWGGRRVLLSPDLALQPARKQTLELSIGQCGGNNVEGKPESIDIDDFDVLIARYREGSVYVQAVLQDKLVGSLTWLFHVQFAGAFSSPTQSLVHYPIPRNPIDGFPKHRITLTNFQGATRDYLKRLIELAGAVFTPNMAGDNTAVIAASLSGTKADKARSWNIPIVNMSWLEDCFIAWRELPMTDQRYTSLPSDTDILPLHVMGGLNHQALVDEARAIAEEVKAERHGKATLNSPSQRSGAAFSVEKERAADSMHSDDAEAGAMDVDMPTETLKPDRRIGKRRAADLSSDSGQGEEPPHRSVSSNERVGRAKAQTRSRNRRESSATTPPITDDAEQSDDTSAVEDALTRPNGSARQLLHSVDASGPSSPVKVLASPVKRQVSVVLPAPRSTTKISASRTKKRASRVSLDLHESDDEDLLAGLKLSPRKPKTSARQPKKTRSHPPGSDSDQPDLSSTPVSPPKAGEGKGKQRAVSPIETQDSVIPRTRKAVAPTTPTSKHAPSTPARRASSDVVPASKGKKQAPIITFPDNDAEEHSRTTLSPAEHVTALTTLSVIGRARRSAATKATQRLHDEIMPDVVNFEKERRRGNVRAIGEKEREAEERIRSKEKRGVEKRRRTSELDEDESEPEPKKRRIGAKLKDKTGATAEDAASAQSSQQEVKIMTTGVSLPDDVNRKLHQLGIRTVLNMKDCTHLIVNRVARTEKFLCAMAIAPVIVDEQWARECATEKRVLRETARYMLRDRDAEKKYKFRLSDALCRAKENGGRLFEGMVFFVTQKVSIDMKLFKAVVAAHGGKVKVQNPTVRSLEGKDEHYVISCAEDITIWRPIAEAGHTIYTTELVLTSALVQEIRWKDPVSVLQ